MPSFSLRISPPVSQLTHPSEPPVSQLEILAEAVVDAGVTTALKFAEARSSEPTLPAAEVFKTLEKKDKNLEGCYHWMTHVKMTKDSSNEYDTIFILKHEALYEGLREYFMSLMPKEQVHATVVSIHNMILNQIKVRRFMLGTHGMDYTDKRTNTAYRFDIEQYAHYRQFLDKRKLASHPFLFVPICNGTHWWLWIANFNKKKFYVLDPVNKPKKDILELRVKLNKFVVRFNNFLDEGIRWSGTLNGGWTGRESREEIDDFRYQYGLNLLLHEMNKIRDKVIWESEAIRLPKLSAVLSSPYCKFTSGDLDSK
ncbi:hypothetical protein Ahy_B06g082066 [Arachis hypogaea]|uniref:Ubiquitin-like protease family profile domain-containing protein n=1 Tax=Arachis hypogaea TaxID=3818 RepID=A0A444YMP9_ARAHY|nr:hypothetical protein Ahy_B06g082066 [Arachis hypogaea]